MSSPHLQDALAVPAAPPPFGMHTRCCLASGQCQLCRLRTSGFNSWVHGGATTGLERDEQLGQDTSLGGTSADSPGCGGNIFQPHLLAPVCQKAGNPLADGWRYVEVG